MQPPLFERCVRTGEGHVSFPSFHGGWYALVYTEILPGSWFRVCFEPVLVLRPLALRLLPTSIPALTQVTARHLPPLPPPKVPWPPGSTDFQLVSLHPSTQDNWQNKAVSKQSCAFVRPFYAVTSWRWGEMCAY